MRRTYGMQLTIDKYTQMVAPLEVRDLDLANAFRSHRPDVDVLRCLRYMHDIELHTICYPRDLLVTSAHGDPEITTAMAARIDRRIDSLPGLSGLGLVAKARASMTGELGNNRSKRLDIVGAHDQVAEAPSFTAA